MSNATVVGTPISITLDGHTFDLAADADPGTGKAKFENTALRSSGRTFLQKVMQDQNMEGLTVRVTTDEEKIILLLCDSIEPFPMSYKNIAEDVYRAVGWINAGTRSAQTGTMDIVCIPQDKWVQS